MYAHSEAHTAAHVHICECVSACTHQVPSHHEKPPAHGKARSSNLSDPENCLVLEGPGS